MRKVYIDQLIVISRPLCFIYYQKLIHSITHSYIISPLKINPFTVSTIHRLLHKWELATKISFFTVSRF